MVVTLWGVFIVKLAVHFFSETPYHVDVEIRRIQPSVSRLESIVRCVTLHHVYYGFRSGLRSLGPIHHIKILLGEEEVSHVFQRGFVLSFFRGVDFVFLS